MLSATANPLNPLSAARKTIFLPSPFLHPPLFLFVPRIPSPKLLHLNPISAALNPSPTPINPQKQQVYQPFRPPQSPLPSQFRSLDTAGKLDVLCNRLGLWFEYAPLISSLIQEGFTPPTIEEATGISGVQQNMLIVGSQVRESLLQANADTDVVAAFDTGGAELLYEIRLVSTDKRAAAARFIVENRLDGKGAQDLARAMKDFPRRRGDKGWENFDYAFPGDCLAFMHFRLSQEYKNPCDERTQALEEALKVAVSDKARKLILEELEGKREGEDGREEGIDDGVRVPVVRMKIGEVAGATSVVVLPVCKAEEGEKEINEAPWECKSEGDFGVVAADKWWRWWVVLPGWEPLTGIAGGGVVVAFADARVLPWKVNRWYREEAILVVADRSKKAVVADNGFYLSAVGGGEDDGDNLKVQRGNALKEMGVEESLGTVVMVVRPPKELNDDQLSDEDWD